MNIAINAATANLELEAGIVTWDRNIVRHLIAIDSTNHYTLYLNSKPRHSFLRPSRRVKVKNLRPFRWICRPLSLLTGERLGSTLEQMLTIELLMHVPDIYFQTGHTTQPLYYRTRTVVTLFDVAYLLPEFAQYFDKQGLALLRKNSARAVEHAAHIITISEHSKADIATCYGYSPDKITVVYPGVDRTVFRPQPADQVWAVRREYGLIEPYVLHVGSLQPRKNLRRLMEAARALKAQGRLGFKLVLVGMRGWLEQPIYEAVSDLGLTNDVIFLGMVPTDKLPKLMHGASALVLPSLYEGFGLTLVEAMACGVPILASNVSSIPEVVGDAGLLLDPYDVTSWAKGIDMVVQNREFANELVAKGFQQVERYSWIGAAQRTLEVFAAVARPDCADGSG